MVVVLVAAAIAGVFFFGHTYRVPGRGMTPEPKPGDGIFVLEFRGPRRALIGEVVAVYWPPSRWGFR